MVAVVRVNNNIRLVTDFDIETKAQRPGEIILSFGELGPEVTKIEPNLGHGRTEVADDSPAGRLA
jgi:hypothetical protein